MPKKIVINDCEIEYIGTKITFETLRKMAEIPLAQSISFSSNKKDVNTIGLLYPGQEIPIMNGMIFKIADA